MGKHFCLLINRMDLFNSYLVNMEILKAYFTLKEIEVLHANLDELTQSGKIGNAYSISILLDSAINRGKSEIPKKEDDVETH